MKNAPSLEERIHAVLTKPCIAAEAGRVRDEAERELAALTATADKADVDALDPLIGANEAADIRSKANGLRFEQDRLEAKVSALAVRVADLLDLEARSAKEVERDAALAERDELAADIARDYPRIVAELTALVQRIIRSDARCSNTGIYTSAEAIGRGLMGGFNFNGTPLTRLQQVKLPVPNRPDTAWSQSMSGWRFPGLEIAPIAQVAE